MKRMSFLSLFMRALFCFPLIVFLLFSQPSIAPAADKNETPGKTEPAKPQQQRLSLPLEDMSTPKAEKVDAVADSLEYIRDQKKIIGKGNVLVHYGGNQITSDYAEIKTDTKQVHATGHVIIFHNGEPIAQGKEVN